MDLYQIFIEHNRSWSSFEIICYVIMLILLFFVYIFLYKCGKVNKVQIIAGLLLFTYYCIRKTVSFLQEKIKDIMHINQKYSGRGKM